MMSTGLGVEFLPTTVGETLYEAAVTALGVVMYAYFLGSATTAITNMNVQNAQRQVQLDQMRDFLRRRKVPERLRNNVVDHCDHMLNRQQARSRTTSSLALPPATAEPAISLRPPLKARSIVGRRSTSSSCSRGCRRT